MRRAGHHLRTLPPLARSGAKWAWTGGVGRKLTAAAVALTLALFMVDAVRTGWSKPSTDFPNYYTAASLARNHQPLDRFYDWEWFQREINRSGFGQQLGGYSPQTPLTMLPFIPLSLMPPQAARRVWLLLNLLFLAITVGLISRMTRFGPGVVWLIAFCSYPALRADVMLGQYYLLLLALFTLCAFYLTRGRELTAGVLAGCVTVLKLYGAPLLLFFAASKRRRAAIAMGVTLIAGLCAAALIFGWPDTEYFLRMILPRAVRNETVDPFNPGNGSAATLLKCLFIAEPVLNPHPLLDQPALFNFAWTSFVLVVSLLPTLAPPRSPKRAFAWWMIALLLASPNTAGYTFVLSILPMALLLGELPVALRPALIIIQILLSLPLWAWWRPFFPRVWLLLILFLIAGWRELTRIPRRRAACAGAGIVLAGLCSAMLQPCADPPGESIAVDTSAVFSGAAAVSQDSITYESMGSGLYLVRIKHGAQSTSFVLPGDAFHPSMPRSGMPVYVELNNNGESKLMTLDPSTGGLGAIPLPIGNPADPAVSPSGRLLAASSHGSLYLFDTVPGSFMLRRILTGEDPRDGAFSSDDRCLIYAAGPENNSRIEQMDLATGVSTTLVKGEGWLAHPSMSRDGTLIAYTARERWANREIRVKRLGSAAGRVIAGSGCNCYDPAFSPASNDLVYSTDCRRAALLPRLMRVQANSLFENALQ